MTDDIVARIYEAAIIGEGWPGVLQGLADQVDATGTTLFVADTAQLTNWVASESLRELMQLYVDGRWNARTDRTERMFRLRKPGFVQDIDVFSPEEMEKDEAYRLFLRPNGLGWGAGTFVEIPSGDRAVYSIDRGPERGVFSQDEMARLDALRPHLSRASILAARTLLSKAEDAARFMESLGLPAAVLGRDQRVLFANAALAALPDVVFRAFERLGLRDAASREVFEAKVEAATKRGQCTSFPVKGGDTARPLVVHLMPVVRSAQDVFTSGVSLLVITPVTSEVQIDESLVAGLFDLTPAESRVVAQIGTGKGVNAAAAELNISRETVRTLLKRALAKLGVRGQSELSALVASAAVGAGRRG